MRWLWAILGVLFAMPINAREARDYKASEKLIVNCIEAAEKALLETGVDGTRQCIGIETRNCDRTTEDTYQSNKRMYCASAEAEVWFGLMQNAFAALIVRYTTRDAEEGKKRTGAEYEPVAPALKQAQEAWEQGKDCEFARIQPGLGTDRYDAPARCGRDQVAERALLYRRWLRGQSY
ncbi:MAG: lysozyme inhibitor LprI family protein [Pseudomonadota bacterium]